MVRDRLVPRSKRSTTANLAALVAASLPSGEDSGAPTWRTFRKRVRRVALEELRLLFDWSLPGPRLYRLSQADRFYIVAKVVVETDEPVYPCRPSEHRAISKGSTYRIKQEIVNAVTLNLRSTKEREAWRKYQEFQATSKGEGPKTMEECLSTQERNLLRRVLNRISRRAGSSTGAGKDN